MTDVEYSQSKAGDFRQKSCGPKRRFYTIGAANREVNKAAREYNQVQRVYRCYFGEHFHLASVREE